MKHMTLQNIAHAVGGQLFLPDNYTEEGKVAQGVVIDNRLVEKDYIFVPIRGAKVDGHTFIPSAFEKGAMAVLADHDLGTVTGPYILVKDTQQALKDLARFYRQQLDAFVIGIVGSVGKTSTKEMVASVLSKHFTVWKTQGNLNNEIGLPLTLFGIKEEHQVAVVEMGISDFGEMDRLGAMAQPDMVIMTNIGLCHLENLIDRDGILRAKTEVFRHMPKDGVIILNGDDDKLQMADTLGRDRHFFGCDGQEYAATDIVGGLSGVEATLIGPKWQSSVMIPIPGRHNVYNALAAMAAADYLRMPREEIVAGIEQAATIDGRNNFIRKDGYTVIDDCYNANPVSMKASLEVLSHASGRKIAVLGDMGELGTDEAKLHFEVGEAVAELGIDMLFTAGELSKEMIRAVEMSKSSTQVFGFDTKEDMISVLKDTVKSGDTILVKASHFMEFPKVVEALTE
ncbi:MAG: UDP-N-acetylmuramoyl-tripeptide--D-alanyl-D-alanine ligase [Lachnospiraceae bacterium]|nr:UDP-N-acetylmuramoyl-tripeptide--D-alanyl-D-alanine ligase [Lachnospiraceae bacterium]